jgi:tetratricopeptide (TPR) repeat protein
MLRTLCIALAMLMAVPSAPWVARAVAAQEGPSPATMTVLFLPYRGVSPADVSRVSRAFYGALRRNRRLRVQDSDKLLAEFAGDVPQAEVDAAYEAAAAGAKLMDEGDLGGAVEKLSAAIAALEDQVPFVRKKRLADAMLYLGVAYSKMGRTRKAQALFEKVLTWRPTVQYNSARFDIVFAPIFERAREAVKRRRRGSIELRTVPPGAKAYIDGRYVGITPTVAFGLRAGRHYATFKKVGYVKAGKVAEVNERRQLSYEQRMRRSEKFLLLKQALATARGQLGQPRAGAAIVDLGRVLFVDQLILTTMREASSTHLDVQAYLYDMRSKMLLKKVRMAVDRSDPRTMPQVARLIYFNVRYDGSLQAPPEPPPPPVDESPPLYTRWWLWVAVTAGIAAGASAVALPLLLREEPCPAGFRCAVLRN